MTLFLRFQKITKQRGRKLFLMDQQQKLSFTELLENAQRLAKNLKELNVKKGDRIFAVLGNTRHFPIALLASWQAQAVFVPVNPLYAPSELESLYNDCQPKLLISDEASLPAVKRFAKVPILSPAGKPFALLDIYREPLPRLPLPDLKEQDIACILYTSGTTSDPKGVVLTHRNLYTNVMASKKSLDLTRKDIVLAALPLYHSFGFTCCLLMSLAAGCSLVLLERFVPQKVFQMVKKYGVTVLPGVPTMFDYLLNQPGKRPEDLSSLRYCFSGGAPLYLDTLKGFEAEFGIEIREGYGLTETSPVITLPPSGGWRKMGSVGKPIEGVEVKIFRENEKECPAGEVGEIAVRGDCVMAGYFNREKETKEVLRNGWFYTGDLGKLDEDGYLYIVGRKKDMVIVGGFNVYPKEVESVLRKHPKIKEVFVRGIKDKVKGEALVAYVVPRPWQRLSYEEVLQFARQHLTAYKIPRYIEIVKQLPRTDTGKVKRTSI